MAPGVSILEVTAIEVKRRGRTVVADASFSADAGEIVAVMGSSGAGKTSVLRAIAGLDPLSAGTVTVAGGRGVGMVFQFHHLFPHLSSLRNVTLAPVHVLRQAPAAAEGRARELLESLGVGDRVDAMPDELSGGEAQRVAIARALAMDPPVLLMDEPTASLDPERREELAVTLQRLAAGGRTLVLATHDEAFARACAHQVVVMDAGRVVRRGTPSNVLT